MYFSLFRKPRRMEPRRLQPTTDSTRHEVTRDGFKPNGSNPAGVQPHQNQPPDSTHHGFNPQRIQPHDGFNLRWMQTMVHPFVTSRAVCVRPNTRSPAFGNATATKTKTKKKEIKKDGGKEKEQKRKKKISKDVAHGGLSHFVAPLYVAPSTTPGNATPTSE